MNNTSIYNFSYDKYDRFLNYLCEQKPLPKDKILELLPKAKQGDKKAIEQLILSVGKLIHGMCRKFYSKSGLPVSQFELHGNDLITEAVAEIVKNLPKYDNNRCAWSTFAYLHARKGMQTIMRRKYLPTINIDSMEFFEQKMEEYREDEVKPYSRNLPKFSKTTLDKILIGFYDKDISDIVWKYYALQVPSKELSEEYKLPVTKIRSIVASCKCYLLYHTSLDKIKKLEEYEE